MKRNKREDSLIKMLDLLIEHLNDKLKSGEINPGELNVALKLLHDNNINIDFTNKDDNEALTKLLEALPFDND